jgi:outer membrane lipoprotein-sorting protein
MIPDPPLPPPEDDPIERATAAMRRVPIPEGPSEPILARTRAALRAADRRPGFTPRRGRRLMLTALKIAGAALATAGGLLYLAGLPPASATAEFAETALKLQEARTLSFRSTTQITGQGKPSSGRVLFKVPGLIRSEPEPAGGPVSILDTAHGRVVILNPADKSAMLLEEAPGAGRGPGPRRDLAASMIEDMRRLGAKDGQPAGERVIGDVRARGFRVREQGQDITVWVDPRKRLPLLVEVAGRVGDLEFCSTLADIRLDPELDDSLFSLDPPAGYALRKAAAKLILSPEEAVVRMLRIYAENSGGRFPTRLDDFHAYKGAISKKKAKSTLEPEAFEIASAAGVLGAFSQTMKDRYGYKPDGVKLGDANAILFWYKPEGAARYRAVYGDLHIGDVSADRLPEKPKP